MTVAMEVRMAKAVGSRQGGGHVIGDGERGWAEESERRGEMMGRQRYSHRRCWRRGGNEGNPWCKVKKLRRLWVGRA